MRAATLAKKIDKLERELSLVRREMSHLLRAPARRRDVFQETAGAWHHIVKTDPVKWQRKIRDEWSRRERRQQSITSHR